jgi:hypothetical protein
MKGILQNPCTDGSLVRRLVRIEGDGEVYGSYLALFALTVFLVIQVVATTGFGISNGRETELGRYADAERQSPRRTGT